MLHEHEQIHRDQKSDNILFASDGSIKLANLVFYLIFQGTQEQQDYSRDDTWIDKKKKSQN